MHDTISVLCLFFKWGELDITAQGLRGGGKLNEKIEFLFKRRKFSLLKNEVSLSDRCKNNLIISFFISFSFVSSLVH